MPPTGWREAIRSLLDRVDPFHLDWIQVEVSSLCQGGCLYCPVSHCSVGRVGGLMPMETFRRLEPWFSSTDLVYLQGWGEPLLHPRLWEMVHRARSAGARVGFTTSGILLDRANRKALLDSGAEVMGVSLAGASRKTHDQFRPGSPLEAVDSNLQALRDERRVSGSGRPDLHLAYLLLAGNLHDLSRTVELAERWEASQIVVSQLSLVLSAALEEQALLARPADWPRVGAVLDEARERAEARGIGFHAYGPGVGGEPEPACTENVLGSCFVSVRGDVSPCVMTNLGIGVGEGAGAIRGLGQPVEAGAGLSRGLSEGAAPTHWFRGREVPVQPLIFGNVRDRSLKEIWHSRSARDFREVFRERMAGEMARQDILPEPCRHCHKLFQA